MDRASPSIAQAEAPRSARFGSITARLPALDSPAYRWLLTAYTIGTVGGFMYSTSQGWLVLTLTNSPGLLALTTAAQNAPMLLLSMVGGALADQVDRRRLLMATNLGGSIFAAVLALLTMGRVVEYWEVVLLAFLAGSGQAIAYPSQQSILPTLVERRAIGNAIALNSVSFNIARIVGPAVAGLAIAAGGLVFGFWANAVGFLVVARIISRLPIPARPGGRVEATLWRNLLAGLGYVRSEPTIGLLIGLAAVPALFVLNIFTFFPIYARDILDIGAPGLGLLLAAVGVGAIAGAGSYAVVLPAGGSARLMLGGLGLGGLTLTIFAVSRVLPVSLLVLVVYGAAQVGFYSTAQSLLQVLSVPRMRGRVMSLYMVSALGMAPVGNVISGLVAERFGVQAALAAGGLITLAAVLATWFGAPGLRSLRADRIPPRAERSSAPGDPAGA